MPLYPPTSGGTPVLDYVENDLTASGGKYNVPTGDETSASAWITGNAVTYDGVTQICIEGYIAAVEADYTGAIVVGLYDGSTFLGALMDMSTGNDSTSPQTRGGKTAFGRRYLTPSQGSHTYSLKIWAVTGSTNNVWSGTNTVGGGTPTKFEIAYLRITRVEATGPAGPTGPQGPSGAGVAKIYDYTVSGSDASSIDTDVDGSGAGLLATDGSMLEIWFMGRTDEAAELSVVDVIFNNDSGTNYGRAVAVSSAAATTYSMSHTAGEAKLQFAVSGSSDAANVAGAIRIVIPAYGDTTFYKTGEVMGGVSDTVVSSNTNRQIRQGIFTYASTSAISRVKISADTSGKKLKVGSRLIVYKRT